MSQSREFLLQRRKQVVELHFVRHLPISEIVEVFKKKGNKWDARTIWRDIEKFRKQFTEKITAIDVRNVLMQIWATRNKVLRSLWTQYDKANAEEERSDAIRALKEIDTIENRNIETLQELGFVIKPEEHITISEEDKNFYDKMNKLFEPDRKEFTAIKKRAKNAKSKKSVV